jgi:polyribonucleotide 5'-hydroxyl-kinase
MLKLINYYYFNYKTGGWIIGQGYRIILHIAKCFKVDVILAIDQEKLYNELVRDQPEFVKVLFTPKSGGVVSKSYEHRRENRDKRIREYFYGSKLKETNTGTQLYPHSIDLPFNSFRIFQIGAPEIPNSCKLTR